MLLIVPRENNNEIVFFFFWVYVNFFKLWGVFIEVKRVLKQWIDIKIWN